MTFDLLSRFRRPVPARDARGHHVQRPPPTMARVHGKRPAPVPQVRPQVRRGHHQLAPAVVPRPLVPARKGPVARVPAPSRKGPVLAAPGLPRKGPVVRAPARPHPPQRSSSRFLDYLHMPFHPSQKRDLAFPPPRFSKHAGSQQAPPFPPPRGMMRSPPRHVHWAPAQAPLPTQPYPYPSRASSRTTSSRTPSVTHTQYYPSLPAIPRYQPPQTRGALVHVSHRRK